MRPKTKDCGWVSERSLEEILVSEPVGQAEFKYPHAVVHPCYFYPSGGPNIASIKKLSINQFPAHIGILANGPGIAPQRCSQYLWTISRRLLVNKHIGLIVNNSNNPENSIFSYRDKSDALR